MEGKKISFGFMKTEKVEKPQVEENKEYIACLEEKSIKVIGGVKVEESLPIVIPMKPNTLVTAEKLKEIADKVEKGIEEVIEEKVVVKEEIIPENETLEQMALRELLRDAKKEIKVESKELTLPIPDKLIADGAKESTLEDYESIPIQDFGMAMLRGMGWDANQQNAMRPRARGRGMRGRRGRGAGPSRPGPYDVNELVMRRIEDLPRGEEPLGVPLHQRPRRRWPLFAQAPPATSPPATPPPPAAAATPPPASPSCSVPSPAMFVEVGDGSSAPSTPSTSTRRPLPRPRQILEADIEFALNHGSEPSSGESDEEEVAPTVLPRVYEALSETPFDEDAEAVEGTSTGGGVPPTATDRPWSFFDFDWKDFPAASANRSRRERFSQTNVGPTAPCVDPYDIFVAIWDRQFVEYIVSETNRYAQQVADTLFRNDGLHPHSRISSWRDTSVDEVYCLFGIILAMGVVVKTKVEEYWSTTSDIFYTPGFSAHMSLSRFKLLSRCLHFNNNNDMCALELSASEAKLFKIQPVLTHLNNKFQSMYNLSQNISLDESLLLWKGWLDISQLIPKKTARMGIKTYEVCESQTGYLWRFEVHAYKSTPPAQQEDPLNAFTPTLVLRLLHGLENLGHCVWMDNFYNSPALARRLKCLGFDCVGTLRTNRKFVPMALHNLTKAQMRRGQITGLTSGDVDVMVWRDSNRVALISTYHGNAVSDRFGSTKPTLILDYNIMMGGVDKKDQLLAMYPIERKRTQVWYKKLFRRLLNVSVLNAHIIQRKSSSSPLSHRNFRVSLITSLLSKHRTPLPIHHLPAIAQNANASPADISHRPSAYALVNGRHHRRRCSVCKKRTIWFCVGCSKAVCMDPTSSCFVALHA